MKGRDAESKKLLTYGFRFYETVKPLQAGVEFASVPVWFGDENNVKLGITEDLLLTIPRGRLKDLKASYDVSAKELEAPLTKGQQVGTINFQLDDKTIEQNTHW